MGAWACAGRRVLRLVHRRMRFGKAQRVRRHCGPGAAACCALEEYNHIVVSTYPHPLQAHLGSSQAGPTEGASRGVVKRDRRAVAAPGCQTHTQRAAAEAAWSRRHRWRHRVLWWQRRNPVPNGQALQQPKAVDRNLSHRGPCGGKPQTPRAGRWREGGLAVLPIPDGGLGRDCRSAQASREAWARGSAGPPASRAPSDFSGSASAEITRVQSAPRERRSLP